MDGYVFYTATRYQEIKARKTELNLAIIGMIYQYQHHPNPNTDGRRIKWQYLLVHYFYFRISYLQSSFTTTIRATAIKQ